MSVASTKQSTNVSTSALSSFTTLVTNKLNETNQTMAVNTTTTNKITTITKTITTMTTTTATTTTTIYKGSNFSYLMQSLFSNFQDKSIALNQINPAATLQIILMSNQDLTGCLSNCSNHGKCQLNSNNKLVCFCDEYFVGDTCDYDTRPCSSYPCMNKANCTNLMNNTQYDFKCDCPLYYYGRNCEKKVNICQNVTCSGHGTCVDNSSIAQCNCFSFYSGNDCEIKSQQLIVQKRVATASSYIAIFAISLFYFTFILLDMSKLIAFFKIFF
jgi:hypothetical protein